VQYLPLIPSDQGSLPSLPFHVAITDGGLEIEARIKKEQDLEKLIKILQTIKPLLQNIYGREPSTLADPPDPSDLGEHTRRVFDASMTPHKEAETGMSFFITKAQKAELQRRGYSEEQIREMKPEGNCSPRLGQKRLPCQLIRQSASAWAGTARSSRPVETDWEALAHTFCRWRHTST